MNCHLKKKKEYKTLLPKDFKNNMQKQRSTMKNLEKHIEYQEFWVSDNSIAKSINSIQLKQLNSLLI